MRTVVLAVMLVLLSAVAGAQTRMYKVRLPDGSIMFTDRPPPGAVIVEERELPAPPPPAPGAEAPARGTQDAAAKLDERLRDQAARREKAYAAVETAERDLEAAKQRLEQGREPQPGELLGTVGGNMRFGPAYEQRLAGLEKAVGAAEQRLAKAREQLNAVR